jgi:malate dehydrogenase (oxaloacetate-decarboxylating)
MKDTGPPPSHHFDSLDEQALELHRRYQGLLHITPKMPITDQSILNSFYLPPGIPEATRQIIARPDAVFDYTGKSNRVAIVTDGSAVLGLGNIGPRAALPVMEGKAILFQTFAGIEAYPICLATQDVDEIVAAVEYIAPAFGGVNLEDISAPRCFEVEERLRVDPQLVAQHCHDFIYERTTDTSPSTGRTASITNKTKWRVTAPGSFVPSPCISRSR